MGKFLRHIWILVGEEIFQLFFRKRAVIILALYIVGLVLLSLSLVVLEADIRPNLGSFQEGNEVWVYIRQQFAQIGMGEEFEAIALISSWPSPVVLTQLMSLIWYPTLVALVSCDMISSDLYRGSLRYLFVRTSRSAYFVSKLAAHLLLYLLIHLLGFLTVYVVASQRLFGFNPEFYVKTILRYLMVSAPFLVFVVAITSLVSVCTKKPTKAVFRVHLVWLLIFLLVIFAPELSPLSPKVSIGLMAPINQYGHTAIITLSAWSLGVVFLAWGLIVRREV